MPTISLSTQVVNTAVCPDGRGKLDLYDTAIPGFILEVRPSGGKTYHLRYRDQHGKQRQHKIGDAQSLTFDKARTTAQRIRSRVVLGENPVEDRKALRQVPTLSAYVTDRYLPHIHIHRRNFQSTVSFLKLHILPRFGALHLDEITPEMITQAHQELRAKGYALATANRLPIFLKIVFNLARKQGVHGASVNPSNPVQLFHINNARERYLSPEETQRLHDALDRSENTQLKHIVGLMLLMGCRKRELLDSKWEHFDLEHRSWRIPMSKSGKARHVPLSSMALEVLGKLRRWEGCPYVVPNPDTLKPFAGLYCSWHTARTRAGLPEVRMHDLRHSFASNLVNSGRSIYEVGKLLGHSQVKTTQRYAHLSDATLMAAMDAAADAMGNTWSEPKRASV